LNNADPQSPSLPAVLVDDVWKSYDEGTIQVLNGISFSALRAETVALCGPSGCGKSTLLHLLGGLDFADRGKVELNGKQITPRTNTVSMLRHDVGFVFQLHNLIADLTLEENCLIPSIAAGTPLGEANQRLHHLAQRTGLSHRLGHRIQKLSGGERQRTALCRALMNRPKILLADEPTGSLDARTSRQIFDLLLEMAATEGITLIMATHDRDLARRCRRLIDIQDGKVCDEELV
jgi:lipoprotein-releasing system ATP-binding protein